MKSHRNKAHDKKRVANDELYRLVRLQDGKERYWVIDEGQQGPQRERQAHRAIAQDIGEELDDLEADVGGGIGSGSGSGSDGEDDSRDDSDGEIDQEIENWEAEAKERRLQALKNVPAAELDSWLQYTGWNEVLS